MGLVRHPAGIAAVALLNLLGRIPPSLALAAGTMALPFYLPFRGRTRARLKRLAPPVPPLAYYRMRLRLALLSLRHVRGRPDGCAVSVEGADLYAAALASGKPVALLGWHQGPVELLHRIPAVDASFVARRASGDGRSVFVMTAGAFSPMLSEWMARGRSVAGARIIRPEDILALRAWAREKGVLAVMVDQVPGPPEPVPAEAGNWTRLRGGTVSLPRPGRLLAWAAAQDPEWLAVSVRWEPGDRIVFRYDRIDSGAPGESLTGLMERALARAPEQYNWSYPKIRVDSVGR